MDDFQRKLWQERASLGGIRSTLDPADAKGLKNSYIDLTHKISLAKEMNLSLEDKVLDFGCGLGRLSVWLANLEVAEIVGLDATAEMIEEARKQCLSEKNLRFISYDGSKIPFPDGYFDKILSLWVLQHIVEKKAKSSKLPSKN